MNKDRFFAEYRAKFGRISSQTTVDILSGIIDANKRYGLTTPQLAYLLATAYHETGHDFVPKREYGSASYFVRRYWTNTKVAKWLGNDSAEEAVKYCGRGLVQITGETNYERFGIADNPDKALEPETAIRIIFDGMVKGIFTGKKLSDYLNDTRQDFYNARRIINGIDRAADIARYAETFKHIIEQA
jgi:putative chitinase